MWMVRQSLVRAQGLNPHPAPHEVVAPIPGRRSDGIPELPDDPAEHEADPIEELCEYELKRPNTIAMNRQFFLDLGIDQPCPQPVTVTPQRLPSPRPVPAARTRADSPRDHQGKGPSAPPAAGERSTARTGRSLLRAGRGAPRRRTRRLISARPRRRQLAHPGDYGGERPVGVRVPDRDSPAATGTRTRRRASAEMDYQPRPCARTGTSAPLDIVPGRPNTHPPASRKNGFLHHTTVKCISPLAAHS